MNKKLWKRITAFVMACTLVTGTVGTNTALATENGDNIVVTNPSKKANSKVAKGENITENIKLEENTPELNRILRECEEVESTDSLKKIRKGQMITVTDVLSAENNRMAIMSNGDLYCWGDNTYGQVGNGTRGTQTTPVKVLSGVKSVSYSYHFFTSLNVPDSDYFSYSSVSAITENGDLYCWGYNKYGQVGNGTTETQITPVKVLSGVKSVSYSIPSSPSNSSVSAITENGDLYCWGCNGDGLVGNGTMGTQTTPVKVLSGVKSVSYSDSSSYSAPSVSAITENGDLYCWGSNNCGKVGNGTRETQTTPVKVLSGVKSVSYSDSSSYSDSAVSAITENGDLYCWGYNGYGQVGNGTTEIQTTPVKVLSGVKSVSYSDSAVSAITENGDLYCWGYNRDGLVGNNGTTGIQTTPMRVLSGVKSVSYSYYSVSAITENGDLYCWGYNMNGLVGNNETTGIQATPVRVLSGVKSVSYFNPFSRSSSVLAITENGDLYCWGSNECGQVGNGTTEIQTTPVRVLSGVKSVSSSHSLFTVSAITENGDLYCWGYNGYGQVGNGTTEIQTTPVKVLNNVKSVSYSDSSTFRFSYSMSAIMENGDLYCWGYNGYGQVGNGTRYTQLTPILILGPSLTPGLSKDGCLQISNATTVEKGNSTYITGKVFADDSNKLKEIGDSLVWSSANPSVATVEGGNYIPIMSSNGDAKEMWISAKVTGISRGETDIFVSAPDGSKVCCHVVVSKSTGTTGTDYDYSYCFSIAGELQEVDSADQTIKIDGISYEAFSASSLSDAKEILEQHDNKIVVCRVRAADNKIERIDDVKDIIGKPSVLIKPEVDNINYENEKFAKKSFKIDLEMYCGVKEPYSISDISDVIKKIDGLEVAFSKVSLTTSHNNTGLFPFLLKDGMLGSQQTTIEKELDFKLKPGQTKKVSFTAYVNENLSMEKVNEDAIIEAEVNGDKETKTTGIVHLSNVDKAREEAQKRLAGSPKSSELQKASTMLNGIDAVYPELALRECLTNTEVKAISAQVYNWIYTLNALNIIIEDDSDSSALKKLLKKCGLTKEEIQNKVLKRLGIDKSIMPWLRSYTGTLQFEAKDKNTGKKITIKFTADMDLYTLGGSAYGGWGTLKYTISSGGSGEGRIVYADMDAFVASLKKVVENQIHNCFNNVYGEGINKIHDDLVADSLISSTFGNIVNQKYGSGSEAVYTGLKSAFTGYTEEDAKKDIKDVVIILTKNTINKKTKVSVDCPVDVTVYDGDGNICAEIIDDVVNEAYQEVPAYVKGEAKYFVLTDTDYILCYSGNDVGTMDYTVTEYENDEVVRELVYNDVPLTTEKKYVNYLASGRHQGISLYNLNEAGGSVVEATFDVDKTKEQTVPAKSITLSDKTLSMEKGQSYILMETISPDDATGYGLTWSSSNDEVVEVSSSGVLYAKADGEAVITVTIDGRNLSDSCKVIVGEKSASPVPGSTNTPAVTEKPGSPVPKPPARPTDTIRPSYTNTPVPTETPAGTISPSYTNTPVPTETPVSTTRPANIQTPKPTDEPTETPSATLKPSDTPSPTAPASEVNGNSAKKLKKGSKVADKKTKAVYKITGTGKNKTVEYVKSTRKNPASISVPISVKLKGNKYKVTSVGKNAFKNSKKLKTVKIGKNVKKIGRQAFSGCKKLTKLTLGKNVTSIKAKAFNQCTALTIITIPSKVTKIGDKAFYQCKNLRYILVKTNKLTAKSVGDNAFGRGAAKLRVKTDKNKWKLYAQIFMSKGMSNKALFIIDPVKLVI